MSDLDYDLLGVAKDAYKEQEQEREYKFQEAEMFQLITRAKSKEEIEKNIEQRNYELNKRRMINLPMEESATAAQIAPRVRDIKVPENKVTESFKKFMADDDGDGINNMMDCKPDDNKRQGIHPNILMKERLRKLPIYSVKKEHPLQYEGLSLKLIDENPVIGKSFMKVYPDYERISEKDENLKVKEFEQLSKGKYVPINKKNRYLYIDDQGNSNESEEFFYKEGKMYKWVYDISDKDIYKHVTAKDAPKEQQQQFYRMIKSDPHLMKQIEKSEANIYLRPEKEFDKFGIETEKSSARGFASRGDKELNEPASVVLAAGQENNKRMKKNGKYRPKMSQKAGTLFHELSHIEDLKDPKYVKEGGIEYEHRPSEKRAERFRVQQQLKTSKIPKSFIKAERAKRTEALLESEEDYLTSEEIYKSNIGVKEQLTDEAEQEEKRFEKKQEKKAEEGFRHLMADADGDGVNNMMDCDSDNPDEQGIHPNKLIMKRLKKLPIYSVKKNVPLYFESHKFKPVEDINIKENISSNKEIPIEDYEPDYDNLSKKEQIIALKKIREDLRKKYVPVKDEKNLYTKFNDKHYYYYDKQKNKMYKLLPQKYGKYNKHITSKDIPKDQQEFFYKTIKKNPHLMKNIEKSEAEIYIRSDKNLGKPYKTDLPSLGFTNIGVYKGKRTYKDKIVLPAIKKSKDHMGISSGGVLFHELKHVEQAKEPNYEENEKLERDINLKWNEMPSELEAEKYRIEQEKKVSTSPKTFEKEEDLLKTRREILLSEPYLKTKEIDLSNKEIKRQFKKEEKQEKIEFKEEQQTKAEEGFRHLMTDADKNDTDITNDLMADADGDGVNNMMDCDPDNKEEQGFLDDDEYKDLSYEETVKTLKEKSKEFRKKKEEKQKRYKTMFDEMGGMTDAEKAYAALRKSAEEHREKNDLAAKYKRIRDVQEIFKTKPVAKMVTVKDIKNNKIKTEPIQDVYFSPEQASEAALAMEQSMSGFLVEEEAKEALAKELFDEEYYHNLTPKQKRKIIYLIRKHIPAS